MDNLNINKQKPDEAGEVTPMDAEATSLVGELSRAGSLSSIIEDTPVSGLGLRRVKSKRKRGISPKRIESEYDSDLEDPVKVDPDLEHLRKLRAELETFLFTDTNKINKSAMKFILRKWNVLEEKVQDLVIENKVLKEKLTFAESTAASAPPIKPYAEVVGDGVRLRPAGSGMPAPEKRKREHSRSNEVILIKSTKEDDNRTIDDIRNNFTTQLQPVRGKLKIRNIRQTRQKGLLIEVNSKSDINMIKSVNFAKVNLKTEEPKKLNPSIIIYDVEKEHLPEDLKRDFIDKNFEYTAEEDKKKMEDIVNFKYKFLNKAGRNNWVIQLPGRNYAELIRQDRIFMCWRAYRFNEYVNITRCFKCHGYGHIAKYCNAPDQLCETCGSKEHIKNNCPQKESPQCMNCKRSKRGSVDHWVRSKNCPEYLRQLELYSRKIEWG